MTGRGNEGGESVVGRSDTVADLLAPGETEGSGPLSPSSGEGTHGHVRRTVTGRADESAVPNPFLVMLGAVTLVGLLLRLPSFNSSLAGDEISTYFIVVGHSLGRVLLLVHSNLETTPPLYFVLAWATKGILASPAQSIRLVSLVTGTAAIPLTFLLGLWTVGRRAALVGAACVALSPYMIYFSTEARPYMLVLFLALLSTLALLRALDSGRLRWWVAYAACTCAVAYTHYTVVFFLVPQVVWALWTQPRERRALIAANVAAGLAYLPWLGGLREDLHAPNLIPFLVPVNIHNIGLILENTWIGQPTFLFFPQPGELAVALAAAGLAVGLLGLIENARGHDRLQWWLQPRTALILVLAVAPAVLVALYSWTRVDILVGQNLIASWPGLALAIGALVTSPRRRPLWLAAAALTLGAFAIGGAKMLAPASQRPNANAAVAFIDRVGTSGDPIVSAPFFANPLSELDVALAGAGQSQRHPVLRLGVPPLAEQLSPLSGPHPQPQFFGLPQTPPQELARQAAALARQGTLFLVFCRYPEGKPPSLATSNLLKRNRISVDLFLRSLPGSFHVVEQVTYPGFSSLFLETVDVIRDTGLKRPGTR